MQKYILNEKKVLKKLIRYCGYEYNFKRHLKALEAKGLLGHDDYSFAVMKKKIHNVGIQIP